MGYQSPRGTEDVLPTNIHRWLHVEQTFREVVGLYGYSEIRTPTFEDTEVFTRSVGDTSDIVTKEMYTFTDRGDRSLTLKPEGTAGVIRSVVQHNLCPAGTIARLSYVIPIFRYERPQKGRMREAHQVGLELVGSASPNADAEVIEITVRFYERLGLSGVGVLLNTIGRDECRAKYREVVLEMAKAYLADQDEATKARAHKNPLRLIDSKDPAAREALAGLPPILNYVEPDGRAKFDRLQELLIEAKVNYQLAPQVVRGLDYYTDTVFVVQSSALGAQSELCGGGRYDNLVKEMGGASTPSVGVAMGIERAIIVLEAIGIEPEKTTSRAFVVQASDSAAPACRDVVRRLRESGISTLTDIDERSLKSQLRQADKSNVRFAILIGEDELAKGVVQVRDLVTGTQTEVPNDENLAQAIR